MGKLSPIMEMEFSRPLEMSADIGTPGELCWIETSQLVIDHGYQRPILKAGENNIRRIIENFNWALFAPLVVAPREHGQFAIIDGQHKATAAKARGIEKLPCLVIAADYALQAKAFSVINGHVTRLDTLLVFRARIAAGEAEAIAVSEAARLAGAIISPYPKPASVKKVNETLAVGSVENIYRRFGPEALRAALALLVQGNSGELMGKAAIRGAGMCFGENPAWCKQKPGELLQALDPMGIQRLLAESVAGRSGGDGYLTFSRRLAEKFEAQFGGGKPPSSKPATTAASVKKSSAAVIKAGADDRRRVQEAHRLTMERAARPPAPEKAVVDERALIEAHLAKHGVRKLDPGASGNAWAVIDWVRVHCGIEITAHGLMGRRFYQVGRKKLDLPGLYRFVNEERKKRNLQPLTVEK